MKAHFLVTEVYETNREIHGKLPNGPLNETLEISIKFTSSGNTRVIKSAEIVSKVFKLLMAEFNN
jgi:hypothetical protein